MQFTTSSAEQIGLFCIVSALTAIIAYVKIWASEQDKPGDISIWHYFTSDKKAVARALTSLLALWAGAGGFGYLTGMTDQAIFGAAIGLGLLVPQRADAMKVEAKKPINNVEYLHDEKDDRLN